VSHGSGRRGTAVHAASRRIPTIFLRRRAVCWAELEPRATDHGLADRLRGPAAPPARHSTATFDCRPPLPLRRLTRHSSHSPTVLRSLLLLCASCRPPVAATGRQRISLSLLLPPRPVRSDGVRGRGSTECRWWDTHNCSRTPDRQMRGNEADATDSRQTHRRSQSDSAMIGLHRSALHRSSSFDARGCSFDPIIG
jgi:hypothetical protein